MSHKTNYNLFGFALSFALSSVLGNHLHGQQPKAPEGQSTPQIKSKEAPKENPNLTANKSQFAALKENILVGAILNGNIETDEKHKSNTQRLQRPLNFVTEIEFRENGLGVLKGGFFGIIPVEGEKITKQEIKWKVVSGGQPILGIVKDSPLNQTNRDPEMLNKPVEHIPSHLALDVIKEIQDEYSKTIDEGHWKFKIILAPQSPKESTQSTVVSLILYGRRIKYHLICIGYQSSQSTIWKDGYYTTCTENGDGKRIWTGANSDGKISDRRVVDGGATVESIPIFGLLVKAQDDLSNQPNPNNAGQPGDPKIPKDPLTLSEKFDQDVLKEIQNLIKDNPGKTDLELQKAAEKIRKKGDSPKWVAVEHYFFALHYTSFLSLDQSPTGMTAVIPAIGGMALGLGWEAWDLSFGNLGGAAAQYIMRDPVSRWPGPRGDFQTNILRWGTLGTMGWRP